MDKATVWCPTCNHKAVFIGSWPYIQQCDICGTVFEMRRAKAEVEKRMNYEFECNEEIE